MKRFALGILFLIPSLALGLEFDKRLVVHDAKPDEDEFSAIFHFQNKTKGPIKILKLESNCGCLSATADKEVYKKGEKGKVTGVFSIGTSAGKFSKSIGLVTDAAENSKQTLTVQLNVPELIKIEPTLTKFQAGQASEVKKVKITVDHDQPIKIMELKTSRPGNVQPRLITVEEGKSYEIEIEPSDLSKPQLGMITIVTDCEIDRHKKKMAFFQIERPKP